MTSKQKKKSKNSFLSEEKKGEIFYNLLNSGLAGAISFFSGCLALGDINFRIILISFFTSMVVALIKFREFWEKQESDFSKKTFNFINIPL